MVEYCRYITFCFDRLYDTGSLILHFYFQQWFLFRIGIFEYNSYHAIGWGFGMHKFLEISFSIMHLLFTFALRSGLSVLFQVYEIRKLNSYEFQQVLVQGYWVWSLLSCFSSLEKDLTYHGVHIGQVYEPSRKHFEETKTKRRSKPEHLEREFRWGFFLRWQ